MRMRSLEESFLPPSLVKRWVFGAVVLALDQPAAKAQYGTRRASSNAQRRRRQATKLNSGNQVMKRIVTLKPLISFTACTLLLAGCASRGEIKGGATQTQVQLKQRNYKVIQAGAMGKSHGFKLLGVLPIVSPNYAEAKKHLYDSV